MRNLLFSPEGRIDAYAFRKGAVVLLLVNVVLWQAWLFSLNLGMLAFFLSLILVYCWGCLFAKRFHDAGKSGWLYLPVFIGFIISSYIIGNVLLVLNDPEVMVAARELQASPQPENPDMDYLNDVYAPIFKALSLPFTLGYLIAGTITAFGINALLISDPDDNQYGASYN